MNKWYFKSWSISLINSKQTYWSVLANGMHNALVVQRETEIIWFHLANNVTFTDHFFQTHILKTKIYIFKEKYEKYLNSNLAYIETSGIHIFSMWFHVQQIVDHGTIPFHWSLLILLWIEFVVRIISSINSNWFNHTLAWRIKVFKHRWPKPLFNGRRRMAMKRTTYQCYEKSQFLQLHVIQALCSLQPHWASSTAKPTFLYTKDNCYVIVQNELQCNSSTKKIRFREKALAWLCVSSCVLFTPKHTLGIH